MKSHTVGMSAPRSEYIVKKKQLVFSPSAVRRILVSFGSEIKLQK